MEGKKMKRSTSSWTIIWDNFYELGAETVMGPMSGTAVRWILDSRRKEALYAESLRNVSVSDPRFAFVGGRERN